MYSRVTVLNASYEPVSTTKLSRALVMVANGVAEITEAVEGAWIRSSSGIHPVPKVLRLVRYIKAATRYLYQTARWSRRGVLTRDEGTCVYCSAPATTVDHLVPSSRGGPNSWLNTAASCKPCNTRKANRTAAEFGFDIRVYEPTVYQLRTILMRRPSASAQQLCSV